MHNVVSAVTLFGAWWPSSWILQTLLLYFISATLGFIFFALAQGDIDDVFIDQTPFYCYPLADLVLHRFCAIQLVDAGVAKVKDVCCAFDLHLRNFSRLRSKLLQRGIAGLFPETSGPKTIRTPTLAAGVVQLYRKGNSCYNVATQLGISDSTVRRILKEQGVPIRSPFDDHQLLPLADDDGELQPLAVQQIEVPTIEPQVTETQVIEATSIPYASPLDRACSALGLIEEAPVEFQSADGVPRAGALLGLALLEETHLLEEARAVYGRLRNGWYGLDAGGDGIGTNQTAGTNQTP